MNRPKRIACVRIPAVRLQLLARGNPEEAGLPAALLSGEKGGGTITEVNGAAAALGLRPGMRYEAALWKSGRLRGYAETAAALEEGRRQIDGILRGRTPRYERDRLRKGTYWLDGSGLGLLEESPARWLSKVLDDLSAEGLEGFAACGFSRRGSLKTALVLEEAAGRGTNDGIGKRTHGAETRAEGLQTARNGTVAVVADTAAERRIGGRAKLAALAEGTGDRAAAAAAEKLARFGVSEVRDLERLPGPEVRRRTGPGGGRLLRMAGEGAELPLCEEQPERVNSEAREFDPPAEEGARIAAAARELIGALCRRAEQGGRAIAGLRIEIEDAEGARSASDLKPAAAGTDAERLGSLAALRIEGRPAAAGAAALKITASEIDAAEVVESPGFEEGSEPGDERAAEEALSRIGAELGDDAVLTAETADSHDPEEAFRFVRRAAAAGKTQAKRRGGEPPDAGTGTGSGTGTGGRPPVVRQIESKKLPARPGDRPGKAGDLPAGTRDAGGPWVVSGNWWTKPLLREYRFTEQGTDHDVRWIARDPQTGTWYEVGRLR